jgi:exopolyphosphatase
MSLKTYLQQLKLNLNGTLKFVTGNQSADMDSCISAIVYSYYNNLHTNQYVVPLINIPKSDFKLRRDIIKLLLFHSIDQDLLYFIDDFKVLTKESSKVDLILVDHCNIQGDVLTEYSSSNRLNVVSIIDHHADESMFLDANPRIIKPCGSCTSLIFNYWNSILKDKALEKDVILLLLGPLLIDTSNYSQKIESEDTLAYNTYQTVFSSDATLFVRDVNDTVSNDSSTSVALENGSNGFYDFYKHLKDAKKDLTGFSLVDILHKDYKQFKFHNISVGFSSIGKSIAWIVKNYHKDLESGFTEVLKTNNIDIIIITTSYTKKENDEYTREFAYYYQNQDVEVFNKLYELAKDKLQLNSNIYKVDKIKKKDVHIKGVFNIYNQDILSASRKQIVPIVKDIIESN